MSPGRRWSGSGVRTVPPVRVVPAVRTVPVVRTAPAVRVGPPGRTVLSAVFRSAAGGSAPFPWALRTARQYQLLAWK
ncbi:hypothetical protein GCM10010140_09500 [Streptosporangium pseudovulgare]|uniref:Uncharacterized protein n=1 Tax=Streptosporangium pseudovulgare TaxID=35765 RepID=A0ABQ2QKK2_9ACTN|nr:hypothetical protein GCM10010140_09500 [Streptosporangium pseudovulgare]